jgi:hypothetical protein
MELMRLLQFFNAPQLFPRTKLSAAAHDSPLLAFGTASDNAYQALGNPPANQAQETPPFRKGLASFR